MVALQQEAGVTLLNALQRERLGSAASIQSCDRVHGNGMLTTRHDTTRHDTCVALQVLQGVRGGDCTRSEACCAATW